MALSTKHGIAAWNAWAAGQTNPSPKEIVDYIKSYDLDKVILFNQFEFDYSSIPHLQEIIHELYLRGKKLTIVTGCEYNLTPTQTWNIDLYRYPNNTIARAYYRILDPELLDKHKITKEQRVISNPESLDYQFHFISLNNRGHQHRKQVIDLLAKYQLLDDNAVSWLNTAVVIHHTFRYFDGQTRILTDNYTNDKEQAVVPVEYYHAFAQLVVESTMDSMIVTEKTATPIIIGKPFISAACPLFHKHLQNMGFVLYDEIFDYSFDTVYNNMTRFEMIVDNFKRLSTIPYKNLNDLALKIKPKLEYNKEVFRKIVLKDLDNYPEPIKECVRIYEEEGIEIDHMTIQHHIRLKKML